MAYAKKAIETLAEEGVDRFVVFTGEQYHGHPAVEELRNCTELRAEIRLIPDAAVHAVRARHGLAGGRAAASFRRLRLYRRLLDGLGDEPDMVISMYLDDLWPAIALMPHVLERLTGVFMRTRFHWPEVGVDAPVRRFEVLNKGLMKRLLRNCRFPLMTFDRTLAEFVDDSWPHMSGKMLYPPDPIVGLVTSARQARRTLTISDEGCWLAVMGLNERKGAALLRDLVNSGKWPKDWSLLLVGGDEQTVDTIVKSCRRAGVRTHLLSGYLSDELWMRALCASDVVWAIYPGHFAPSGVLACAAQARKPALAWKDGVMAYEVRRGDGGYVVASVTDIVDALAHVSAMHCDGSLEIWPGMTDIYGSDEYKSVLQRLRRCASNIVCRCNK